LLRQGAELAWLARQHSIDGFKDSGGDRGWLVVSRGADPVQEALFDAGVGDVIGPLGQEGNYFVLRVNAREEQGYFTLKELSATARQGILQRKYLEAMADYLGRLRERADIKVNQDALQSLQITGKPGKVDSGSATGPHGQR
jgi:parvulin-like peptidyl-prolyl isomerase